MSGEWRERRAIAVGGAGATIGDRDAAGRTIAGEAARGETSGRADASARRESARRRVIRSDRRAGGGGRGTACDRRGGR